MKTYIDFFKGVREQKNEQKNYLDYYQRLRRKHICQKINRQKPERKQYMKKYLKKYHKEHRGKYNRNGISSKAIKKIDGRIDFKREMEVVHKEKVRVFSGCGYPVWIPFFKTVDFYGDQNEW